MQPVTPKLIFQSRTTYVFFLFNDICCLYDFNLGPSGQPETRASSRNGLLHLYRSGDKSFQISKRMDKCSKSKSQSDKFLTSTKSNPSGLKRDRQRHADWMRSMIRNQERPASHGSSRKHLEHISTMDLQCRTSSVPH